MDDLVYFGWFGWVARPLIALLHGLHALIGNYGIAIILLTVLVRGAMFPLSRRQAISSQKMQALQPEMKVIADKFKNEPEKRHRATQDLWRKHGVNPVGGCLPVFIQIPIFMGLYRSLATDVELRQAPLFSSAIRWCSNLAAPDMFWDWTNVLPAFLTAPDGYLGPFLNLFPLATIGLFLWQQQLFMPPAVDEQSQIQQQVMKYMMFFMALMFFKVPCGLCLYFIASSLWGIAERLMLPTTAPAAAGAAAGGSGKRVIDVPFFPGGGKPEANGAAHGGETERKRRQARKKR
jgi:YidC/Oxa1 family membrane protein insertase